MRASIPLSLPGRLVRTARWTTVLRIVLGLALVGLLAAAFFAADRHRPPGALLPGDRSPIVALDVSWSVSYSRSKLIARTMREFSESGRRLGLVLFSDTAYEALPPGTRSIALGPFLRFFDGSEETNPWRATYSAGTRIGAALDRARQMLHDGHIENGAVVLISDLADSPNDEPDLARALIDYENEGIPIRMVAVDPQPEDVRYFREALRPGGGSVTTLHSAGTGAIVGANSSGRLPVGLIVAACLIALLLALNEQMLGTLTWRRRTA